MPALEGVREKLFSKIEELVGDFSYDKKSYTPLISRFANDILEILILNPITDKFEGTRVNKFLKSQKNIESIMVFDSNYNDELEFYEQDLVKRLLIQESAVDLNDIKRRLDNSLKEVFKIEGDEDENFKKFKEDLAKTINDKKLSTKKVIKNIYRSPAMLKSMSEESYEELQSFIDKAHENALESLISNAEMSLNYKEVKEEINEDINSLEFILNNIVLKAVKIEEPFKHSIEYQIQAIKNDLESGKKLKSFVNSNIAKIESEKFAYIENRYKKSQEFNEVISVCEEVIAKL